MKWTKGILDPEKIRILDYRIIKGVIDTPLDFNQVEITGFSSDVSFSMSFNLNDSLVKADFQVEVITQSDDGTDAATGSFHLIFIYLVENFEQLVSVDNLNKPQLDVHPDLSNALASVTYSTARGILMTRFQGTALDEFILPVIDPNSIL